MKVDYLNQVTVFSHNIWNHIGHSLTIVSAFFSKIGYVINSSSNLRLLKKYKFSFSYYSEQIWKETGWDSEICRQKELRLFALIPALKESAKFSRLYSTLFSSNTFQFSTRIKGFKIVNRIPSSPTQTHSLPPPNIRQIKFKCSK